MTKVILASVSTAIVVGMGIGYTVIFSSEPFSGPRAGHNASVVYESHPERMVYVSGVSEWPAAMGGILK